MPSSKMALLKFLFIMVLLRYGDGNLSEMDYLIERQRILDALAEVDQRLHDLKDDDTDSGPLADDEFIEKASYFIMVQKLLDDRCVDYKKYIRQIDPTIPRSFIKSIIEEVHATDGKVTAIVFKNDMTHKFSCKA